MSFQTRHIAIVPGHPDPRGSRFCHALAEAYSKGATEAGHEIDLIDVVKLKFRLLRSQPPEAIQDVQNLITRSDHLVLIYPVWNGTVPAWLKGFLEQTFRPARSSFPIASPASRWDSSPTTPREKL